MIRRIPLSAPPSILPGTAAGKPFVKLQPAKPDGLPRLIECRHTEIHVGLSSDALQVYKLPQGQGPKIAVCRRIEQHRQTEHRQTALVMPLLAFSASQTSI